MCNAIDIGIAPPYGSGVGRFPKYLPSPNDAALSWIAQRLARARSETVQTAATLADAAEVEERKITDMERGIFAMGLGELRNIIELGYGLSLTAVLAEYYEAHREFFLPRGRSPDRPFRRDFYYRGRLKVHMQDQGRPTPLLTGGDPERYIWGVPFRELEGQTLATEFLELAPMRRRAPGGTTNPTTHDGEELIQVIHGSVQVCIEDFEPSLAPGEHIHFRSTHQHHVRNVGPTPALILVVRSLAKTGAGAGLDTPRLVL